MNEIKIRKGFKFIKSNDQDIIRDIKEYFEEPQIYLKHFTTECSCYKVVIQFKSNILIMEKIY